eukprot:3774301-Amphidinium_carterae.1
MGAVESGSSEASQFQAPSCGTRDALIMISLALTCTGEGWKPVLQAVYLAGSKVLVHNVYMTNTLTRLASTSCFPTFASLHKKHGSVARLESARSAASAPLAEAEHYVIAVVQ